MLIRLGYDIELEIPQPLTVIGVLNVHPSRERDLLEPDEVAVSPSIPVEKFVDSFGNRGARACWRLQALCVCRIPHSFPTQVNPIP
jgi:hypothetical protein